MATSLQAVSASPYEGMGAEPIGQSGVSFRVWAPFAKSVAVTGTFNNWHEEGDLLASENNGYWSVYLQKAAIGHEYKYLLKTQSDIRLEKNDPYARSIRGDKSVIAEHDYIWKTGTFSIADWNKLVIYEMHIGTFTSDVSNPSGGRGTFKSAIAKLDYLQNLGINAIEIMAAGEFAFDISWGYNPDYIFAIEYAYGGPNGFREFVDACHSKGIAVIFDVVYNHLGPQQLDMWQFDGWSKDGLGGIYFYNDWRCKTPWGHTRPDYGRPEVRQYLRDNAVRWLKSRKVDGLRWDATGYIRNVHGLNNNPEADLSDGWSLMQAINYEIRQTYPGCLSIAEDMQNNEWLTKPLSQGGAGFTGQWDAKFVHTVRDTIIRSDDEGRNMYAVADAVYHRYPDDAFKRVIYTESHDEVENGKSRVPESIWTGKADSYYSKKRSTLGAVLTFTAPGIPMIFQGQEFLEDGFFDDERLLDWSKSQTHSGIRNLYADLIALRRNTRHTTRGLTGQHVNVFHINNEDKVIAFHRWEFGGEKDDVVVLVNFGSVNYQIYNLGFPRPGLWTVRFNSDSRNYSDDYQNFGGGHTYAEFNPKDGLSCSANIAIGRYSALILSQS